MSNSTAAPTFPDPKKLSLTEWLIMTIAAIGFAFDIYELLMLPLVVGPALAEFGITPTTNAADFSMWLGRMFYFPAFFGGIFGLLGGYMTDYFGRRSVLTWSILIYAVSAFCAGFSTGPWMLLFFRTTTFVGVCIEFVAAVAWLAELFPNPHQREKVLGYTQAFSSIGGLLVAVANSVALGLEERNQLFTVQIPEFLTGTFGEISQAPTASLAWRYTLMSGLLPAIPLIIIRPFLPESPIWAQKAAAGTLKPPSFVELFSPELRRTTIVTMIMFACSYGAAFGAIQQMPRLVPGLTEDVAAMKDKIKSKQQAKIAEHPELKLKVDPPKKLEKIAEQKIASDYTKVQEIGGLLGRFALAFLATLILSRRWLLRVFQVPGLIFMPMVFYFFLTMENTKYFEIPLDAIGVGSLPITNVSLGMMFAGFVTVAQFSFWGNYLPTVYPVHLRGTGESVAANIGGRLIGTSFAWVTATLATILTQEGASAVEAAGQYAVVTAGVSLFVYLVGSIACFFLPEPKGDIVD